MSGLTIEGLRERAQAKLRQLEAQASEVRAALKILDELAGPAPRPAVAKVKPRGWKEVPGRKAKGWRRE